MYNVSATVTHSQEQPYLLQMEGTTDSLINPADNNNVVEEEHKAPPPGDGEQWLFDYVFDYFKLEQYGRKKLNYCAYLISSSILFILYACIGYLVIRSTLEFSISFASICYKDDDVHPAFHLFHEAFLFLQFCVGLVLRVTVARMMLHVAGLVANVPFDYRNHKLGNLYVDPEVNLSEQEQDPVPLGDGEKWVFDPFFDYFDLDRLGREKLTYYAQLISNTIRFILSLYFFAWTIVSNNDFFCYLSFKFKSNSFRSIYINIIPFAMLGWSILFFIALRMMFYVTTLIENVPFDYLDHRFGKLSDKQTKKD